MIKINTTKSKLLIGGLNGHDYSFILFDQFKKSFIVKYSKIGKTFVLFFNYICTNKKFIAK